MLDWNREHIAESILDTAGSTPLVRLNRVTDGVSPSICGKIEYFGPSGSLKDRILPFIVHQAELRGDLRAGMTIIEGTTGNTGISTAMVGAAKGYKVVIVMPEGMSDERKKMIAAYGAELVLTPGAESDVDLVLEKVTELKMRSQGAMWEVGQFSNADNVEAHYRTTGPEIWQQTKDEVDFFVAAAGSGGTITGVARYLKERNPTVKIFVVEPSECAVLSGGAWGAHRIEGIGDGFIPDILDLDLLDGVITVSSAESIDMARRLAAEEGIFCGISSGCNVAASVKLAGRYPDSGLIVTMINDTGLRYLSTELGGETVNLEVPSREHQLSEEDVQRLSKHDLILIS